MGPLQRHRRGRGRDRGLSVFVPLDRAPLLDLPIIVPVGLALGRGPGLMGTLVSTLAAASFFTRPEQAGRLTGPQEIGRGESLAACAGTIIVCDASGADRIVRKTASLGERTRQPRGLVSTSTPP